MRVCARACMRACVHAGGRTSGRVGLCVRVRVSMLCKQGLSEARGLYRRQLVRLRENAQK